MPIHCDLSKCLLKPTLRFRVADKLGSLNVLFENGVQLGEMVRDVDGYYKWFPIQNGGYWEPYVLRAIADTIDVLNEPWDKIVQSYFSVETA